MREGDVRGGAERERGRSKGRGSEGERGRDYREGIRFDIFLY